MSEFDVIEVIQNFATGNTLVMLYLAVSSVRYILLPVYRNGKKVSALVSALTKALEEGAFTHNEVVLELKAINEALVSRGGSV